MKQKLSLPVLTLLLVACGSELDLGSEVVAIVGGEPVADGEIPAVAYIGTDPVAFGGFFQWCGATVVSEHWVVTAAHCIDLFPLDFGGPRLLEVTDLRVITGKVSVSDFTLPDLNPVVAAYIHPNYDQLTLDHDIAVLRLAEPIIAVSPMALITERSEPLVFADGDLATLAGWGATDPDDIFGSGSRDLLQVELPVVNRATCEELYQEGIFGPRDITEAMLCAGDTEVGGVDACLGDSGGPLLAALEEDHVLGGVVSFGEAFTCADPNFPAGQARVAVLASWVEQCIADEDRCDQPGGDLGAVEPKLDCVEALERGRFRAHFGYRNRNAIGLAIPRGRDNVLFPRAAAGQPQVFASGRVNGAFSVEFRGLAAWALTDPRGETRITLAHPFSRRCNESNLARE